MNHQDEFQVKFGSRLRNARLKENLTEQKLGEKVGVSKSTISNWETGKSLPNVFELASLSKILATEIPYWLNDELVTSPQAANGVIWQRVNNLENSEIATGTEIFEEIMRGKSIHDLRRLTTNSQKRQMYSQFHDSEFIRLLRTVFLTYSVRLIEVERDLNIEQALQNKYRQHDFSQFIVANTSFPSDEAIDSVIRAEVIGFLAANSEEVRNSLRGITSVGLTGGTPLSRFVDLLQPDLRELDNIEWISLLSTDSDTHVPKGISSNSLVARMIYRQSSSGNLMPFLNYERRIPAENRRSSLSGLSISERQEIGRAYDIVNRAASVSAAFITVGAAKTNFDDRISLKGSSKITDAYKSLSQYEKQLCCGDILLRLVDSKGQRIGNESFIEENITVSDYNERVVFSITYDDLRHISSNGHVWILAERPEKAQVIHAALTSGLANSAIIDKAIAQIMLNL